MNLIGETISTIITKGIPTHHLPPLLVQKIESCDIETAIEMGNLNLIIHFLPYNERRMYESIIDGSYVSFDFESDNNDNNDDIYYFLIWSAKKSGLLTKHILEKLHIDNSRKRNIQDLFPIACSYGHFELVEYLAVKHINSSRIDMGEACANNHLNIVEYLVKRFNLTLANINFRRAYSYGIVKPYAACDDAPSVIRWVLEKFDPPVDFIIKNNILKFACCGGIFDDVKCIVRKYGNAALGSHLVHRSNCFDNMYQNTDIMKYVVDNLFATFNEHAKALLLKAIEFENTQLMEHIIDKFNLSIHDMGTALPYKPMVYKFLVEKFNLDAKFDYKNFSHQYLNLELVMFLTQKSNPSHQSLSLLIKESCKHGHLDIVKYLLDTFNIDFDKKYLHYALEFAQLDVAAYLVERWSARDYEHVSSPEHGCLYSCLEAVKYLVETFPNYDIRHDNNLPLRKACAGGNLDVVKYIVEKFNITVNEILNRIQHSSALQYATLHDRLEVVEYLVDKFNLSLDNFLNIHGDLELKDVYRYIRVAQYIIKKFNVKPYQIRSKESFATLLQYGVFKVSVA
jgi:ankyrin repeat protein